MSGKKRRNSDTSTNSSSSSLKKRKSNDGAKLLSINVVDQRTKSSASNKKYVVLAMIELGNTDLINTCKSRCPEINDHMQFTSTLHISLMKAISRDSAERFADAVVKKNNEIPLPQTCEMQLSKFNDWQSGLYVSLTNESTKELLPLLNWMEGLNLGSVVGKNNAHISLYRYRGSKVGPRNVYNNAIENIRTGVNVEGKVRIVKIILKELGVDYDNCIVLADCS